LGTTLFLLIIFKIAYDILRKSLKKNFKEKLFFIGFLFGLVALMINASYIDVFEASKVAYTFWLIAGIFIGYLYLANKKENSYEK